MESALPHTVLDGRGRKTVAATIGVVMLLAGILVYAGSRPGNVGVTPGAGGTTMPGRSSTPTINGLFRVYRVRGSQARAASHRSEFYLARHAKIVVAGTTADGASFLRDFRADAKGRFKLNLPDGRYVVSAIAYNPASIPLSRQPHETVTVTRGRIVDVHLSSVLGYPPLLDTASPLLGD